VSDVLDTGHQEESQENVFVVVVVIERVDA